MNPVANPAEKDKGNAELRDYLAAERTFLAWIRTGLALMGFGFVVARFGLFLAEFQRIEGTAAIRSHQFSLFAGTALIVFGIGIILYSAWSHVQMVGELNRGGIAHARSPRLAVLIALFLAVVGLAMAVYLTFIRES